MKPKPYDLQEHGVTQGLLQRFMSCRKSTRIFLEGWSPKDPWSAGLNFGSIMHGILEKVYIDIKNKKLKKAPDFKTVQKYSAVVEKQWYKENPSPSKKLIELTELSFAIAEHTAPLYFDYWKKEDFKKIKWLAIEKEFKQYAFNSGINIPIRGKS